MITREEVLKIAKLSKLSFEENELQKIIAQMGNILTYVDQLNELDTEGVLPTARVIASGNVLREDVVTNSISTEEALKNAPSKENNMFKVPKI